MTCDLYVYDACNATVGYFFHSRARVGGGGVTDVDDDHDDPPPITGRGIIIHLNRDDDGVPRHLI